jgi:thioredoxin 1
MSDAPQQPTPGGPAPGRPAGGYGPLLLITGALLALLVVVAAMRNAPPPLSDRVVALTARNWAAEVDASPVPVLVDFNATWCGPCRQLAPTVDKLAEKYAGKIKVGKVDVDEEPELATKFGVSSIPLLLIFHGGPEPRWGTVGLASEATIAEAIDGVLSGKK